MIPEHKGVPAHWHYDVRYVVVAGRDEDFAVSEDSLDLAWRDIAAVAEATSADESLRPLAAKALARAPKPLSHQLHAPAVALAPRPASPGRGAKARSAGRTHQRAQHGGEPPTTTPPT